MKAAAPTLFRTAPVRSSLGIAFPYFIARFGKYVRRNGSESRKWPELSGEGESVLNWDSGKRVSGDWLLDFFSLSSSRRAWAAWSLPRLGGACIRSSVDYVTG
jgi:hypothetical protein